MVNFETDPDGYLKAKEDLNDGQLSCLKQCVMWYMSYNPEFKKYFTIFGYAGTGKSFIIQYIIKTLKLDPDKVAFCAFTGNAATNMIKKR